MVSGSRIVVSTDALGDLARRVDRLRDDTPREVSDPPVVNDDELARAGRDAADVLRASLRARQADMEGLVVSVRQVAAMWEEREASMVARLNEIAADLPGSAVPGPAVPNSGAGPMRMRPQ